MSKALYVVPRQKESRLSKKDIEFYVYLMGIIGFGLFYYGLKSQFESQWLFVVVAMTYLGLVRLAGFLLAKWPANPEK